MEKRRTRNWFLWLLVAALLAMLPVPPARADDSEFIFDAASGTITAYHGSGGEVVIPASIDGAAVTAIGAHAFELKDSISSVVISEGVTVIGDYAFSECYGLESITLPSSLRSIGDAAFYYCGLAHINLPEGLTNIGSYAFLECNAMRGALHIPDSVTNIGNGAFYDCSMITEANIPEGITSVADYLFLGCPNLSMVNLPSTLVSIGDWSFQGCYSSVGSPVSITLPQGVTSIGEGAFDSCTGLGSVSLPAGLQSIGARAFTNSGLTNIDIPAGVSLGDGAFSACHNLVSIELPPDLTALANDLFAGSNMLQSLTIPSGVTSIGDGTFQSCIGLIRLAIPNGITSIGAAAFQGCVYLTSISLPTSLTSLGEYAFFGCSRLTSVHFQGSPPAITGDLPSLSVFQQADSSTIYYSAEANGWAASWEGRPTAPMQFAVDGGTLGSDYAYIEHILTFLCPGSYSVSLRSGVTVVTDSAIAVKAWGSSEQNPVAITLSGVDVQTAVGCAFEIADNSTVHLSLTDVNRLCSGSGLAGLQLLSGNRLTLSGPGSLLAVGGAGGAGIGGCSGSAAGRITIVDGNVTAIGGTGGAGIGGGDHGAGGTATLSGGVVFAEGDRTDGSAAQDIGRGDQSSGGAGTLTVSGDAAVFLRNDDCAAPLTTHTHQAFSGFLGGSLYLIPLPWTGDFGAYLPLFALTFDANAGTGALPPAYGLRGYLAALYLPAGDGFSRAGHSFVGWNTVADGSGSAYAAGDLFSFSADSTLYAQWNAIPRRLAAVPAAATASVSVNTAFALDLAAVFADAEDDPLNYRVAVGGASAIPASQDYQYTPSAAGETTLVFTANDGWADSADTYTVTLTATPGYYLVGLSAQPAAGGTVSGGGNYQAGDTVTVTATANESYDFINWTEDGAAISTEGNYQFTLGEAARQLVANFLLCRPVVTVTSAGHGSVSGGGRYSLNATVQLSAVPDSGYNFAGWYDGDEALSSLPNYRFPATREFTLTARFVAMPSADLGVAILGGGSVRLNGGSVALDENYLEQHRCGTSLTLAATPDSGYSFGYWQDAVSGSLLSTEPVYQTVLGAGLSLKAVFTRVPDAGSSEFTVIFLNKSGRILQSTKVAKAATATAPIEPSLAGYRFLGWDQALGPVTTNLTIRACYQRLDEQYHLSVINGTLPGGGTSGDFLYDWPVTVVADPAPSGQQFSHWEQDGVKVSTSNSYSFFTPLRDTTLTAVFVADTTELPTLPFITLSSDVQVDVTGGTMLFVASRNLPTGYTLVESGILLLQAVDAPAELTLETAGVLRGKIKNDSTDQFYVRKTNVAPGSTWHARAYLIYQDADGNIVTVYSQNTVCRTLS